MPQTQLSHTSHTGTQVTHTCPVPGGHGPAVGRVLGPEVAPRSPVGYLSGSQGGTHLWEDRRIQGVRRAETKVGRKPWNERERREPRGGTRELFRVRERRPPWRQKMEKEGSRGVVGRGRV